MKTKMKQKLQLLLLPPEERELKRFMLLLHLGQLFYFLRVRKPWPFFLSGFCLFRPHRPEKKQRVGRPRGSVQEMIIKRAVSAGSDVGFPSMTTPPTFRPPSFAGAVADFRGRTAAAAAAAARADAWLRT